MVQKKRRVLLAESTDTAETLRALFEGHEDAFELSVVSTDKRSTGRGAMNQVNRVQRGAQGGGSSTVRERDSGPRNSRCGQAQDGGGSRHETRRTVPELRVLLTSGYSAAAGGIPADSAALRPYSPAALAHVVREILGPAAHE